MSLSKQSAVESSHVYAIEALVAETDRPLEEVAEIYMRELGRLREGARVEDYLVLLTSKRVRQALRRSDSGRFVETVAFNPRLLGWPITPPPVQTGR